MYGSGNWGIEVFLAMSDEQAKKQGCYRCMGDVLPGSDELYHKLDEIPEHLCISKTLGWQKEVCLTKDNFFRLAREWDLYLSGSELGFIESVESENIWLMGFGG